MKTQSPSGSRGVALATSNLPPWLSLLRMVLHKGGITMRKVGISSTLTVFHDGQFWVGVVERNESGRLAVSKTLFGAEPSNEEILRFVVEHWQNLDFSEPITGSELPKRAASPKRRMREASKAIRQHGVSTKAQQALSKERESRKAKAKSDNAERRQLLKDQRFEQKKAKRKQKKKGK